MSGILEGLVSPFENLASGIKDLRDSLLSKIASVINGITGIKDNMVAWFGSIFDQIFALPGEIWNKFLDGLQLLFIPSDGYFVGKFEEIREKFSFVDCVIETAESFGNFFLTANFDAPPHFEINMGKANSKYDWGGNAVAIDFSWYAPYKPSVDTLLSGILWVVFCWNTYKALPSIISGTGSAVQSGHSISEEVNKRDS